MAKHIMVRGYEMHATAAGPLRVEVKRALCGSKSPNGMPRSEALNLSLAARLDGVSCCRTCGARLS